MTYRQIIQSDGDLTVIIQNSITNLQTIGGKPPIWEVRWHVMMVTPESGGGPLYRHQIVPTLLEALAIAEEQWKEEYDSSYAALIESRRVKQVMFG